MAFSLTETTNGLGTTTIGVPNTGDYSIQGNITLPTIPEGETASSSVVVTIAIAGGATIYTGPAGAKGFQVSTPLTAGNSITISLASSNPVDQRLNAIKTTTTVVQTY